jgi:hypothetical protein
VTGRAKGDGWRGKLVGLVLSGSDEPSLPRVACTHGSSPPSDTIVDYTGPGLDEYPAVVVVGEVDPHLFVDGGPVCRVGRSQCCGDVSQAGYQGFDVVFGEPGGGFGAEERVEALAFLSGLGDPPSYGCCRVGFVADDAAVAVEFTVEFGDALPDLLASGLVVWVGLGGVCEGLAGVVEVLGVEEFSEPVVESWE